MSNFPRTVRKMKKSSFPVKNEQKKIPRRELGNYLINHDQMKTPSNTENQLKISISHSQLSRGRRNRWSSTILRVPSTAPGSDRGAGRVFMENSRRRPKIAEISLHFGTSLCPKNRSSLIRHPAELKLLSTFATIPNRNLPPQSPVCLHIFDGQQNSFLQTRDADVPVRRAASY